MLNQLLSQLRAPIQLPACLKVVGYLRRMDAFGETELRLRFLQARDSWLSSTLKAVPKDDPFEHLSKSLELTRVHLFDIVTQYRALFSDDETNFASIQGKLQAKLAKRIPMLITMTFPGATATSHRSMFSTWLDSKIQQFLRMLQSDLDAGAKRQSLDSIMSQAMYFGQSLGRVGADFRPALVKIFSKTALEIALEHLNGAEQSFKVGIDQLALKAISTNINEAKKEEDQFQPPIALLDFLPLAELCNCILSCLNEVRLCAPLFLAPRIISRIQDVLISAVLTLKEREARFGKSSIETEKATFQQLVTIFCHKFLPYIDRCLKRIFPITQLTLVSSDAKFCLDCDKILQELPLKDVVMASLNNYSEAASNHDNTIAESGDDGQKSEDVPYVIDRVSVIAQEIDAENVENAEE